MVNLSDKYVVNLLRGLWKGECWCAHLLDVGVLVGKLVVGILVSVTIFRWEYRADLKSLFFQS